MRLASNDLSAAAHALAGETAILRAPARTVGLPAPAPVAVRSKVSTRNLGFDGLRVIASLAIVWVHTPRSALLMPFKAAGVFGTAFFTAASIYYLFRSVERSPERPFLSYLRSRAVRLGAPFLGWSILYLLFRNCCRQWFEHQPPVHIGPELLLLGTEMQLWFLPFIFIIGLLLYPVAQITERSVGAWLGAVAIGLVSGTVLAFAPIPNFTAMMPHAGLFFECAWWVLPSVCWGVAASLIIPLFPLDRLQSRWVVGVSIAVTGLALATFYLTGETVAGKNIAGLAWLLAAVTVRPMRHTRLLAQIAPLAFGIYLIHPMLLSPARLLIHLAHLRNSMPTPAADLAVFAFAILASIAATWTLRGIPGTRWLIP